MQKYCSAQGSPELPARWWSIKQRSSHKFYGPPEGAGMPLSASLLISKATL
jgi:hypothetical protein